MTTPTVITITLVCAALLILFCRIIDVIFTRLRKLEEALSSAKLDDLQKPVVPGKPAAAAVTALWKLEEKVSSQGRFLNDIHVVLQRARMMPYAPTHTPLNLLKGSSDVSIKRGPVNSYDVVALKNGQIIGYLAEDGTWTLDPKRIKIWMKEAEAEALRSKVELPKGEGVTTQIRGHTP